MATDADPVDTNEEEGINDSELDRLVGGGGLDGPEVILRYNGTRFTDVDRVAVQVYDFTNPVVFSDIDLQKVRVRVEQFAHYLGGHLSMFLRKELTLQLNKFESLAYKNFTREIGEPACVRLFKLDDLNGVCVLNMSPKLAISIVELLLGGQGHSTTEERDLTDIEKALIDDAVDIVLDEFCRQWRDALDVSASVIGRESSGRFLQTSPRDALMLHVVMEATFGDVTGNISLGIPYYTLKCLAANILTNDVEASLNTPSGEKLAKWQSVYDDINVPVVAEWEAFKLSVGELLSLKSGDILELPVELLSKTELKVEGSTCFIGEVGVDNGNTAIKINSTKLPEE